MMSKVNNLNLTEQRECNVNKKSWPDKLEWLRILVSHDTTSSKSNLMLIHEIRNALISLGLNPHLSSEKGIHHKSNLFVTIPSSNGSCQGGIMLSGHTDTVPVTGQKWNSNPFVLLDKIIENNSDTNHSNDGKNIFLKTENVLKHTERRLYGRGTCDMKGFISVCLAYIPKIIKAHLSIPVHIALSYDEEVGCLGIPSMIQDCKSKGIKPDLCFVGEPTSMLPVIAHKSVQSFLCQVYGHATHSSLTPQGVNAIEYAARIICKIKEMANKELKNETFDENFDIPFTTSQTGLITGGNAINTVPEYCEFSFEFRTILNNEIDTLFSEIKLFTDELEKEMRKISEETCIKFRQLESIPALEPSHDPLFHKILREYNRFQDQRKVAYATEAGIFSQSGIPTLVCGPGSIKQAHRANEYVSFSQLQKCELFLEEILTLLNKIHLSKNS